MVINPITGIGEPTSTGIEVVDFAADPAQFQNNAQFSLTGSGYVNMGAYDYTLVEDKRRLVSAMASSQSATAT
ncbi:autotransporter outer membrane beta-barrel domain-containing protein [Shigella sonnei]